MPASSKSTFNLIQDDAIIARYGQTLSSAGRRCRASTSVATATSASARSIGHLDANVEIGDPGLPAVAGKETFGHLSWRLNNQDSAVIPSRGTSASAALTYIFDGPDVSAGRTAVDVRAQERQAAAVSG